VTRGGTATGDDRITLGRQQEDAWIRKAVGRAPALNPQKEKETYLEAGREFADPGASASRTPVHGHIPVYDMPPLFYLTESKILAGKVSTLKTLLQSCMTLLRDERALG